MEKRTLKLIVVLLVLVLIVVTFLVVRQIRLSGLVVGEGSPSLNPPINSITVRNDDSSAMDNYPVTIGRLFVQGEVLFGYYPKAYIDGAGVTTQVDVKNRWSDNSLKFAIISFVIPQLNPGQTKTVTFQNIDAATYQSNTGNAPLSTTDMLSNTYNFDAIMELVNPAQTHPISARTMLQDSLQNSNIRQDWLSGPVVTSIVLADHSAVPQYDVGWKQQGTPLALSVGTSDTVLSVQDASWISAGQTLNLNNELVLVVNTASSPDTVTVQRNVPGGLPPYSGIDAGNYLTSTVWQSLSSSSTDDKYRSFRPMYEVEFWSAPVNKVKVRFIGENANPETMQDVSYDLNLKLGYPTASTIYSQTGIIHHIGARWAREFWLGGGVSEKLTIDYNFRYLIQTGYVDNYDPSVQPAPSKVNALYNQLTGSNCGIFKQCVFQSTAMGTGGGRPELDKNPLWDVILLTTPDWRMKKFVRTVVEEGGAFPTQFREGDPTKFYDSSNTIPAIGKPISAIARPSLFMCCPFYSQTSVDDKLNIVSRITSGSASTSVTQPWEYSAGHTYNLYSIYYALDGSHNSYEQLLFAATYTTLVDTDTTFYKLGSPWGARYQFTSMYPRVPAAWLAVDGTPEKTYLTSAVINAIVYWMGMQNILLSQEPTLNTPSNQPIWNQGRQDWTNPGNAFGSPDTPGPLNFWQSGSSGTGCISGGTAHTCIGLWQFAKGPEALGYAQQLGYPVNSLLQYMSDFYAKHFTTPGVNPVMLGAYYTPTTNPSGQWFTSLQDVFNALNPIYKANPCWEYGGGYCTYDPNHPADSYFMAAYQAIARLHQFDTTSNAYDWMRNAGQGTMSSGSLNNDPRYFIVSLSSTISCTPNQPQSCTTVLPGVCALGTRTCNAQGDGYGSCTANIQPGTNSEPGANTCNGQDDDCDGTIDEGCSCSFFSGNICSTGQICVGQYLSQSSDASCCSGTCQILAIPSGLVAAYAFEEGTGTTAIDSSGQGNTGTFNNGVQRVAGKFGNGVAFDGFDDYIFVANSASLNPTTGMTITAWVKDISSGSMVVSKGATGDQYHLRDVNGARFVINGGTGPTSPYYFSADTWYHIAVTYDGNMMKTYVDGVQIGSTYSTTISIPTSTVELNIGRRSPPITSSSANYFTGGMDEVRIYNKGLTPGEVLADMNLPMQTCTTNCAPSPPTDLNANIN